MQNIAEGEAISVMSTAAQVGEAAHGPGAALSLDIVYHRVREAILRGELEGGATISQVKLARALNVSRTPLREALRLLERDGLVVAERNRRVRVAAISVADLEGLYSMRIVLEALAITLTVPALTEEDFRALDGLVAEMPGLSGPEQVEEFEQVHRAFHRQVTVRADARLRRQIDELSDQSERYRRALVPASEQSWSLLVEDHRSIVEACRQRNPVLASERISRHIARPALTLLMMEAPEHEPAAIRTALRLVGAAQHEQVVKLVPSEHPGRGGWLSSKQGDNQSLRSSR